MMVWCTHSDSASLARGPTCTPDMKPCVDRNRDVVGGSAHQESSLGWAIVPYMSEASDGGGGGGGGGASDGDERIMLEGAFFFLPEPLLSSSST